MASVEPSRAGLLTLFDACSEEQKWRVEQLCLINKKDDIFKFVSPETFVASMQDWLTDSVVYNEDFFVTGESDQSVSKLPQLCLAWLDIFSNVVSCDYAYAIDRQSGASKSDYEFIRDFFAAPVYPLSEQKEIISKSVRLLCYFAVRHYFRTIDTKKIKYKGATLRIKALAQFTLALDEYLSKDKAFAEPSVFKLEDAIDLSEKLLRQRIDKDFFADNLREAFDEVVLLQPRQDPPTENKPALDGGEGVELETASDTMSDLFEELHLGAENADEDIAKEHNENANVKKLRSLCVPASLTSITFLQPSFQDYQRKPEYALHVARLNYALTQREKLQLVELLLNDLNRPAYAKQAMILLLEMLTCSTLEQLTTFVVTTRFNDQFINTICVDSGLWRRHSLIFDSSFKPEQMHHEWLNSHDDFLQISLPPTIIAALKNQTNEFTNNSLALEQGVALYQILALDDPKCIDLLNDYLVKLKTSLHYGFRQLTQKSVRYALYSEIAHSADASTASLLFASSEFSNPITLYYLSLSENELQKHFNRAAHSLGFQISNTHTSRDILVGSRMCVDMERLSNRVRVKVDTLKGLLGRSELNINSVIRLHNDFAHMVTLAFAISGAAREQAKFLFDYTTVSESHDFITICDKFHRGESPIRIVPLSGLLKLLLQEYRLQLRVTSQALQKDYPDLAKLLFSLYQPKRNSTEETFHTETGQPLLGIIVKGAWQAISSKSLSVFLGDDFTLPPNFTRHLTCSQLPPKLFKYRQQIMGHHNQGHHALDEMTTSLSWLSEDEVTQGIDSLLSNCGITELKAQSLRGAYSLEPLPAKALYYPKGYLERQSHHDQAYNFASKHFRDLLKQEQSLDEISSAVEDLPKDLTDSKTNVRLDELVKNYYYSWSRTLENSKSKRKVERQIGAESKVSNISLQIVEYHHKVERLQRHFLDCIANGELLTSDRCAFFISLALYQPRVALQLLKVSKKTITFLIKKHQSTLLLFAGSEQNQIVSSPINWLSTFLLTQIQTVDTYRVSLLEVNKVFKQWMKTASQKVGMGETKVQSITNLCMFVSNHGLYTQCRLSASALSDSYQAGDYPIEDIGRLLKHSSGHLYGSSSLNNSKAPKRVRKRKLLSTISHENYDFKREKAYFEGLGKALNDMSNTDTGNSVRLVIFDRFSQYVGQTITSIQQIFSVSNRCSEFLILCTVFCIKESYKPSPVKRGRLIQASTIQKYLLSIRKHLQEHLQNTSFLMADEESFEELYSQILKNSTYENKSEVFAYIKNFHEEVEKEFVVDRPDWDVIRSVFDSNKKQKRGIARLFSMADYNRAIDYFKHIYSSGSIESTRSQLEYDMHIVIMALAFRAGLRKREIRNLQVRHINTLEKLITITATRYFSTKSNNSPRRIDVSLLLNNAEWDCLMRLLQHAKQMGGNTLSRPLFGSGILELRLLSIDTAINNIMHTCRLLCGNGKLRFYDLRHSYINYTLMLLAKLYQDKRYENTVTQWARCERESLDAFRQKRVQQLIGGQAEVGGILIYGLARELGHSPLTQRQYYMHVLSLIDEVTVNRILSKQIPQTLMFNYLKAEVSNDIGAFRPEHSIRKQIKNSSFHSLAKQPVLPLKELPACHTVLNRGFIFESQFMHLHLCLKKCWRSRGDESVNQSVIESAALPLEVWSALSEQLANTGYQSIYLPDCSDEDIPYKAARVDEALRYINTSNFQSMLSVISTMYADTPDVLNEFVSFYLAHQIGDDFIVKAYEKALISPYFSSFKSLSITFTPKGTFIPRRGRNAQEFKVDIMSSESKRKSNNAKFNFLLHLTNAVLVGLNSKPQ